MDTNRQDASMDNSLDGAEDEIEVTREELVDALRDVVQQLATGLKGPDRDAYLAADDLAQNDWFFGGVSDEEGQYAITMWPAEGEENYYLRVDIGSEDDVHTLASNPEQIESITDDFIAAMDEEFEYDEDEEDLEEDEDDLEDEGEEDLEDEELDSDLEDDTTYDDQVEADDVDANEDSIGRNGKTPL